MMLDALALVLIIIGCCAMRVWLEVRLGISAWVLSGKLVWNMRIEGTAHGVFVEAHCGRVGRSWVLIDAES